MQYDDLLREDLNFESDAMDTPWLDFVLYSQRKKVKKQN